MLCSCSAWCSVQLNMSEWEHCNTVEDEDRNCEEKSKNIVQPVGRYYILCEQL